jgi:hypothetical protein
VRLGAENFLPTWCPINGFHPHLAGFDWYFWGRCGCLGLIVDLVARKPLQCVRHVFNGRLLIVARNLLVAWPQIVSRMTFSICALAARPLFETVPPRVIWPYFRISDTKATNPLSKPFARLHVRRRFGLVIAVSPPASFAGSENR